MSDEGSSAVAGISDHRGWAVVVCVAPPGRVVDRRRVTLIGEGVEANPIHHADPDAPLSETEALIRVTVESATTLALEALHALKEDLSPRFHLTAITLPEGPNGLPDTVAGVLANYKATLVYDAGIYRDALCNAALALDIAVVRHPRRFQMPPDALLRELGKAVGPPWRKEHRVAAAAALAVLGA